MPLTNEPNENIAWQALSKIQIAQLLHLRPDLRDEYEQAGKKLTKGVDKIYNKVYN